jgi:hypothetical protein
MKVQKFFYQITLFVSEVLVYEYHILIRHMSINFTKSQCVVEMASA